MIPSTEIGTSKRRHLASTLAALAFLAACGDIPTDATALSETSPAFGHTAEQQAFASGSDAGSAGQFGQIAAANGGKVDICHVRGNGGYSLLSVSATAVPSHKAHGDLVVGVDADENCQVGSGNSAPVAFDGPAGFIVENPETWPFGFGQLVATDADPGDVLTYSIVPGSIQPSSAVITLDPETGEFTDFCIGEFWADDPYLGTPYEAQFGQFQWQANDGTANSNVATQTILCFI